MSESEQKGPTVPKPFIFGSPESDQSFHLSGRTTTVYPIFRRTPNLPDYSSQHLPSRLLTTVTTGSLPVVPGSNLEHTKVRTGSVCSLSVLTPDYSCHALAVQCVLPYGARTSVLSFTDPL